MLQPAESILEQEVELLYREHYRSLCLTALQYVREIDSAQDIVQDFFINYWERRHQGIEAPDNFIAYARRAVRNLCVDFSGRYDGASQFGSNVRFAPFWSAGAGINLHNYAVVRENMPWITNFKLRTNYGQVGKAGFSQSVSKSTYRYTFDQWYASGIGATIISLTLRTRNC